MTGFVLSEAIVRSTMEMLIRDEGKSSSQSLGGLFVALTFILASCEADVERIFMLKNCYLFGSPCVKLMPKFWNKCSWSTLSEKDLESIQWAAQLVDMWHCAEGISISAVDRAELLTSLEKWLAIALAAFPDCLARAPSHANLASAMSSAVNCYVTLQGDEPPDDATAGMLQQVLQICAASKTRAKDTV